MKRGRGGYLRNTRTWRLSKEYEDWDADTAAIYFVTTSHLKPSGTETRSFTYGVISVNWVISSYAALVYSCLCTDSQNGTMLSFGTERGALLIAEMAPRPPVRRARPLTVS